MVVKNSSLDEGSPPVITSVAFGNSFLRLVKLENGPEMVAVGRKSEEVSFFRFLNEFLSFSFSVDVSGIFSSVKDISA